jgi:hypothetical protein
MQKQISAKLLVVLSTIFSTLLLAGSASGDTIDLMWDRHPQSQVGYVVHVGTQSGTYTQHIDVGSMTAWSFTNAAAGQKYCFTVTAYVSRPLEGPPSNEACGWSNAPPALTNPGTQSSKVGQPASLQLIGSDPKGDVLTYSATGLPPGLKLMASTGYVSGTPTASGSYLVTARVSDGTLTASQTFTWTTGVVDTAAPVVTISSPTSVATYSTAAATVSLSGTASDSVGVTQVTWVNNRGGSGTASGATSWTVPSIALQAGSNLLTVTARDAAGNTASDVLTVTVNAAPTLTSVANQSSTLGLATTLQLSGSDSNGDALTYSATGLPNGLAVAPGTGLIRGTPTTAGTFNVSSRVSDGSLTASRTFTWTITASDTTSPAVTITSPTTAAAFKTGTSTITFGGTAVDNVRVTQVTWSNSLGGSGTATGTTNWSASIGLRKGLNLLTITARDAAGNLATDTISVTYSAPDTTKPAINITNPVIAARTSTATSLVVRGTANDGVGVTQVTWRNSLGGGGLATGTDSWSANVMLRVGANVISVTARDAAGNTLTKSITVTKP